MSEQKGIFKPNNLKERDIDELDDWQLLVAACHFGDTMGDCVSLDYGYELDGDDILCDGVSLKGDIDLKDPIWALNRWADFSWRDYAKKKIVAALKEGEG